MTLVHKTNEKSDTTNYRLVKILQNLSKICEKLIYNQLYSYFDKMLFPYVSAKGAVLSIAC